MCLLCLLTFLQLKNFLSNAWEMNTKRDRGKRTKWLHLYRKQRKWVLASHPRLFQQNQPTNARFRPPADLAAGKASSESRRNRWYKPEIVWPIPIMKYTVYCLCYLSSVISFKLTFYCQIFFLIKYYWLNFVRICILTIVLFI